MSTTTTQPMSTQLQMKGNQRVQLEALIRDFQNKLGKDWEKYHESLTLFLVGKLSRAELVHIISPMLKNGLIKWHNKFLLLNFANSLQDSPVEFSAELASFWNKKNSKTKSVRSTQYEKFKRNIMGLPLKERRRLRSITRDKRNKISSSITLTRQALLPKIPMIQDREQQQLQVNNLVQWQQDVVNGINTPLSTTIYELPDSDNLSRRVLMTMREHGLTGGVNTQVLEMLSLGLEAHLKNILENTIDVSRYRESKYSNNDFLQPKEDAPENGSMLNGHTRGDSLSSFSSLTRKRVHDDSKSSNKETVVLSIEDMYNTLEMFPHLVEPNGAKIRLSSVMLQNDDQAAEKGPDYVLPEKPAELDALPVANGTAKGDENAQTVEKASKLSKGAADVAANKQAQTLQAQKVGASGDPHVGTADELKWLLHDLVSAM